MTKVIADILDIDALRFRHMIEEWEARSGRSGHDLKLYSDMRIRAKAAVEGLGLDPSDTIAGELYFALQERAKRDNLELADYLQVLPSDTPELLVQKLVAWVTEHLKSTECFSVKPNAVRLLLQKQPPKQVMKVLGLRSVDSMLKRNQPAEILAFARVIETKDWNIRFNKQYKKIKPTDFAAKDVSIIVLDAKRYDKLSEHRGSSVFLSEISELGSLVIGMPQYRFPLDVLAIFASVTEHIASIRKHSAFYRALSTHKEFSGYLVAACNEGLTRASLTISDIGWNSLHRHLVGNEYFQQKIEQPHLTAEDLQAESALDLLARHRPEFQYWKNLEFSFYIQPGMPPVSMNLVDVVANAANKNNYGLGYRTYGKMKLWEELWARYLSSDSVAEDIVSAYVGAEN